jgi:tetratricopeptide (TPR) repeat protein
MGKWHEAEKVLMANLQAALGHQETDLTAEAKQRLGAVLFPMGKYDQGYELAAEGLTVFEKAGNTEGCINSYLIMGNIQKRIGRFPEAMETLNRAALLADGTGRADLRIKAYGNIGVLHTNLSRYQQAVECFEKVSQLAEESGSETQRVTSLMNIGHIDLILGRTEQARVNLDLALEQTRKIGDRHGEAIVEQHLSELLSSQGDFPRALEHSTRALGIFEALGDRLGIIQTYNSMGLGYYNLGDFQKAEQFYLRHYRGASELEDKIETGMALGNLSNLYRDRGQYPEALDHCRRAKEVFETAGHHHAFCIALDNMGTLHRLAGEAKKAGQNYDQAIEIARRLRINNSLSSFLQNRARLYFDMNETAQARADNREALQLAEESGREDVRFKAMLLDAVMDWKDDSQRGILKLKELAEKTSTDEQSAEAHYQIFSLVGDQDSRRRAEIIYQRLRQRTPKYEYETRLSELHRESSGKGAND